MRSFSRHEKEIVNTFENKQTDLSRRIEIEKKSGRSFLAKPVGFPSICVTPLSEKLERGADQSQRLSEKTKECAGRVCCIFPARFGQKNKQLSGCLMDRKSVANFAATGRERREVRFRRQFSSRIRTWSRIGHRPPTTELNFDRAS